MSYQPTPEAPARSPQAELRSWLRERIDEIQASGDEISVTLLVEDAIAAFGHDPEFLAALAEEAIATMIPSLVQQVLHSRRQLSYTQLSGNRTVTAESLRLRSRNLRKSWAVHTATGRWVPLGSATKLQIQLDIDERQKRVNGELRNIEFEVKVHAVLPTDESTPDDAISDEQLDEIYESVWGGKETDNDDDE